MENTVQKIKINKYSIKFAKNSEEPLLINIAKIETSNKLDTSKK